MVEIREKWWDGGGDERESLRLGRGRSLTTWICFGGGGAALFVGLSEVVGQCVGGGGEGGDSGDEGWGKVSNLKLRFF